MHPGITAGVLGVKGVPEALKDDADKTIYTMVVPCAHEFAERKVKFPEIKRPGSPLLWTRHLMPESVWNLYSDIDMSLILPTPPSLPIRESSTVLPTFNKDDPIERSSSRSSSIIIIIPRRGIYIQESKL